MFQFLHFSKHTLIVHENEIQNIVSTDQATPVVESLHYPRRANALKTVSEDNETANRKNMTVALIKQYSTPLTANRTSKDVQKDPSIETGLNPLMFRVLYMQRRLKFSLKKLPQTYNKHKSESVKET